MKQIRHTGIYVDNLENMKSFYCNMFDLKVAVHDIEKSNYIDTILGLENTEIELYKLTAEDGSMIELLHRKETEKSNRNDKYVWETGCMHLAFTVKDADRTYQYMKENGYECVSKPCIAPSGTAKVFFARDLEGNFLEIVEEMQTGRRI